MALLWLESTSPSHSIQSMVTLSVGKMEGRDSPHTKYTDMLLLNSLCSSIILCYCHLTLVLTWWPWVPCRWPWCSSAHPSCHRHAPSGRLTTTFWFWIRWQCPGRNLNLLNVTSGVFWVPTRWSCPTRFPDTQEHVQRRGQQYLSCRYKTTLLESDLLYKM